ncbi:MAG: short-chain fatty acid transporter, partial [Phycisphaerales bacterium]|nr:short-chain fatty acid transporter [Phycisphaerales bacterium]
SHVALGVSDVIGFWADPDRGVWGLLRFAMEMCLILVTGHALASSPPMVRAIRFLARRPASGAQAAGLVALVAATLGLVNWGLGLIGGALIARDVGRAMEQRGVRVHYPVLAAAGYVGLMVWHGGFSGTAPLKMSNATDIASVFKDVDFAVEPLALKETLLSPLNITISLGLLVIAVVVMALLNPRHIESHPISTYLPLRDEREGESKAETEAKPRLPRLLEDTPIMSLLLCLMIGWWAWMFYVPQGPGDVTGLWTLSPSSVNLTMLMLGLLMHGTPLRYVRAVEDAARGCAGIILQFPLYAGIMGMMNQAHLTHELAAGIASLSDVVPLPDHITLPVFTFLSAGVINLFIPSGGGQWAVQGPVVMNAVADNPALSPARMVMAVAYGDQLTNMLQPFWAVPLLAITGVKARDIVGYTCLLMLIAAAWVILCLCLI